MTQAEKILAILEMLELIELAIASNDRQKQLDYVRRCAELRREIKA